MSGPPLLQIRNLETSFPLPHGMLRAVNDVTIELNRGEILGLVGESGSGKSILGFSVMNQLVAPGRITGGSIKFDGQELTNLSQRQMRELRGKRIAMIFQDPMMTLNPVLRIDVQMVEAIQAHARVSHAEALARARDALAMVGIPSPEERLRSYPHQFSGGMRQRVAIAIALLNEPDLIIADEPTTALDVTIQAQILSEILRLSRERNIALIWISHDLSVVSRLADRVAVMYGGRIVEAGEVREVIHAPRHPYTRGLIESLPGGAKRGERLRQISGTPPNMLFPPPGCAFSPRCPLRQGLCSEIAPDVSNEDSHQFRCHYPLGTGISKGSAHEPA
ncbi:ABC transporter ATP-binding protein [Limoniibacter endophyticus]|uniref:ABC transporter ATP-binding protein n=1 Tax=Limoniibacter endophyticus TaxID=1565040 RepID=A0A8J3DR22_9HYPH|nr:ABC transporter ATP-binding protein [Limoniibacter endophyticus]GHC78903.1 ABC transporter ATP-binding protein [Limoniibacter endophyticus]